MFKISSKNILYLILYSIPNTIFNLGILYIINSVLVEDVFFFQNYIVLVFFGIIVCSYFLNIAFQRKIIELSNNLIYNNEIKILNALKKARLPDLENLGKERIYGILEDLRSLVFIPYVITNGLNSLFILVVGLIYFVYISFTATLSFLFIVVIFIVWYFYKNKGIVRKSKQSRNLNDTYFQLIRDFLEGFKELKLSFVRQSNIIKNFLAPNRIRAKELEVDVSKSFLSINLLGQYGIYVILGVVIFIFPYFKLIQKEQVVSFVIIILFLTGPINTLVSLQTFYTRLKVATTRISDFLKDINYNTKSSRSRRLEDFENIYFSEVAYNYANGSFGLKHINVRINKGETVFIIGGNGSGKSTFINLLTNLYNPTEGKILFNETPIGVDNQEYRDQISAIFTDNHLFSENYENYTLEDNTEYEKLLNEMQLDTIVQDTKEESIKRKFSKGQSKRMAMIFALLNNRPILVLDEWAADQDPYFRKYFYENILPKLKKEGKTIIAVTHDDAYFKHADRIIKFDYGQIVKDFKVKDMELNMESLWHND